MDFSFKDKTNNLDKNKNIGELFSRIEEYFYRIQKEVLNNKVLNVNKIQKSILRIITDLMIITGNLSFSDMHQVHYSDILELSIKKDFLGRKEFFKNTKEKFTKKELSVYEVNSIVNELSEMNVGLYSKKNESI